MTPICDLVIATKKIPYISGPDGYILWWKVAGQDKQVLTKKAFLTDDIIQKRLTGYRLVSTEARQGEIVRRYTKEKTQ